jgi:LacI family transcriptional regulator
VLAVGLLHAAYKRGLRVPDQLSVTGFDDIAMAAFSVPSLTTARMPVREMVEKGVQMALDETTSSDEAEQSPDQSPPTIEPTLVVRDSTGRAPA